MLMLSRGTARTRLVVAVGAAVLSLSACGSTVQVRSTGQDGLGDAGLSAPGGTGGTGTSSTGTAGTGIGGATTGSGGASTGLSATGGTTGGSATGGSSGSSSTGGSVTGGATGGTAGGTTSGTTGPSSSATGPIQIGAEYVSESGLTTAAKAFGVDLDLGPILQEEQAMVAHLNSQGGINKRKVNLVSYEDSTSANASDNSQAACSKWTQDSHVLAAITVAVLASSCLAQKNVIEVQGYNTANTPLSSQLKSTPLLTIPNGLTLDRLASTYGAHMGDAGFFTSGAKLGVIYNDTPSFRTAYSSMKSALASKKISVTSDYAVPAFTDASSAASLENAVGNAVIQFRSAGVTHVMFLDNGTTAAVFFAMAADNQKYYPRYGLNGGDAATIFAADVKTAKVLAGAQVLGYTPAYDTYKSSDYLSPAAKACAEIYRKAGVQIPAGPNPEAYSLEICDSFLYLAAALTSGGADTPDAFLKGRAALARSGYATAMTYGSTASPDGVRTGRIAAYSSSCSCFGYTGPKIAF